MAKPLFFNRIDPSPGETVRRASFRFATAPFSVQSWPVKSRIGRSCVLKGAVLSPRARPHAGVGTPVTLSSGTGHLCGARGHQTCERTPVDYLSGSQRKPRLHPGRLHRTPSSALLSASGKRSRSPEGRLSRAGRSDLDNYMVGWLPVSICGKSVERLLPALALLDAEELPVGFGRIQAHGHG
jgi:hypothetical protein